MSSTTTVKYGCPSSGCYESHTAVVNNDGLDRATTTCKSCKNNILVKTRNSEIVAVRVM